jgi:transcriptional regulator with XRE-family HTH domain
MYPNLKLQLWKSGIRQNRLAQILGVDETVLSKVVNGFREPSPQMRDRIAGLLQSDVDWLFERVEVGPQGHNGDGHGHNNARK